MSASPVILLTGRRVWKFGHPGSAKLVGFHDPAMAD
jgi:hypothetical protein